MDRVPVSIRVPVTIIVPAYNEARRLPGSLPRLIAAVAKIPGAEVIVVDDGSTDGTAAIATDLLRQVPNGRVVRLPWNTGKGTAVRVGVSAAAGEAIVFMDADMASDVGDLPLLLAALDHAEVALGSRRIGGGAERASTRRMGSWAFNQITRSLAALDLADTQCGFKAFRHAEAKILFGLARSTGFGFDVEVLSIAKSMGYRIAEVPVRWAEAPGGTFRVTRHTPSMIVDVVRARRYLSRVTPSLAPAGAPAHQRSATQSVDAGRPATPEPVAGQAPPAVVVPASRPVPTVATTLAATVATTLVATVGASMRSVAPTHQSGSRGTAPHSAVVHPSASHHAPPPVVGSIQPPSRLRQPNRPAPLAAPAAQPQTTGASSATDITGLTRMATEGGIPQGGVETLPGRAV